MDLVKNLESVLHNPVPFAGGGQTISDRFNGWFSAKHSLAGSQLGKTVCKATTEEVTGPKKKHLDYLLHCTHEANVSIPQLANLLIERAQNEHWCVSFKSLITIHNLMCYGNERFSQYLASCNARLELENFMDTKSSSQGYDMSMHVRQYANYITEKIKSYRMMAFDFCKVKRGCDDGLLRTMSIDNLTKTLPVLTGQIDALLGFKVEKYNLNNGVINSAFILLFRDLIRLFACYNDGIINTLGKYFDMPKKQCKDALKTYKEFLTRMENVREFFFVAEAVGIDKSDIPDLAAAPASLLTSLENHLASIEGKPIDSSSNVTSPTASAGVAIHQLSSGIDASRVDQSTKQRLLDEEQRRLDELKRQRETSAPKFNPFEDSAAAPPVRSSASSAPHRPPAPAAQSHQNVDDLLGGSSDPFDTGAYSANPFSSGVTTLTSSTSATPLADFAPPASAYTSQQPTQPAGLSQQQQQQQAFFAQIQQLQQQQYRSPQPGMYGYQPQPYPPVSQPYYSSAYQPQNQGQFRTSFSHPTLASATNTTDSFSNNNNNNSLYNNNNNNNSFYNNNNNGSTPGFQPDFGRHFGNGNTNNINTASADSGATNPFASSTPSRPPPAAAAFNPFADSHPPPPASRPPPPMGRPPPPTSAPNPFGGAEASPAKNPFGGPPPGGPPPRPGASPGRPPPVSRPPPPFSDSGVDPLGDVLQPAGGNSNPFGGPPARPGGPPNSKLITRDVDSSLANLSSNLSLQEARAAGANRPVQWNNTSANNVSSNPFA